MTAATKRKSTKVKLKGIKFRADRALKNGIGAIKVKPLKLNERSTAQLHIRRLRSEGKLKNVGIPTQPIYVPCAGYYGRSE